MATNPVHMATASQTHFPISSQGKFISIVRSAFHLVFSRENLKVENRRSVLWDEVDMGNEEIIGVATKFVKANCYSPNPKMF
jgi:hypothetical protein